MCARSSRASSAASPSRTSRTSRRATSWRSTRRARSSASSRSSASLSAGYVALVLVHLHFPEAGSLKAKRKELSSLKSQLSGRLGVAVSEVDHQDLWQRSTLAAAVTAGTQGAAQEACDRVARFLDARLPQGYRRDRTVVSFDEVL